MSSRNRASLQVEPLESIVALSGTGGALAHIQGSAAEVSTTPGSFALSGVLKGPLRIDPFPGGVLGAMFGPVDPEKSMTGEIAGHLATLGPAQITGEISSNGAAAAAQAQWSDSILVLWAKRGPIYLDVEIPPAASTAQQPIPATMEYQIVPGMSRDRPTVYAPGSGVIDVGFSHLSRRRDGSIHAEIHMTFIPGTE
jgi:hypothetical protein